MRSQFLSYEINEQTPTYGGVVNSIRLSSSRAISKGDTSNNTELTLPNHIGTHIDFPRHFSDNGQTLSDYPASFWLFDKVAFLEADSDEAFLTGLKTVAADSEILLWRSGFGKYRGTQDYWKVQPVIPASFAQAIKSQCPNIRVFGFDMISLTSQLDKAEGKRAHISFLLEEDILVVEDMKLQSVNAAPDQVIIAPLLIQNSDGAPCTIIAVYEN